MEKAWGIIGRWALLAAGIWAPIGSGTETPHQGRAVSVKVLQATLAQCQERGGCSDAVNRFAGLTRIRGYVVDEKNRDLVLFGDADPEKPALQVDDFVVAARNTWLKYATRKGNTYFYAAPACSIDPDSKVLGKLQVLQHQIFGRGSASAIDQGLEKWHEACRLPQRVRVMGVPIDTHFAHVMVQADYDMKRLADGSDDPGIEGFHSVTGALLDSMTEALRQGSSPTVGASLMNRFWFYPGLNRYREDRGIVLIAHSDVKLLTEEEHLDAAGGLTGTGSTNPFAEGFARDVTDHYDDLALRRPIYYELENLYRFVALAQIWRHRDAPANSGLSIDFLLDRHRVGEYRIPREVPGRSHVEKAQLRSGNRITTLWMPSCGGVDMGLSVGGDHFARDTTLAGVKSLVLAARPSSDALSWDYSSERPGPVSVSSPIVSLQTKLKGLGYYGGKVDGIVGSQTQTAVRSFQGDWGLDTTGETDPLTVQGIDEANATQARLRKDNRHRLRRAPFAVVVQALKQALGSYRYLVFTGLDRPRGFADNAQGLDTLVDDMNRRVDALAGGGVGLAVGLQGFPVDLRHAFAFNVLARVLSLRERKSTKVFVRSKDDQGGEKTDALVEIGRKVEKDQRGFSVVGYQATRVLMTFYARTRAALVSLLAKIGQLFLAHPAYMSLSAEEMARAMRRDIEKARREVSKEFGEEEGHTEIEFRDESRDLHMLEAPRPRRLAFRGKSS